jgi:LysM repeat protein
MKQKTILFEKEYGVDINNINSTEEIDEIIEKKIGRKLKVKNTNVFPVKNYNIESKSREY